MTAYFATLILYPDRFSDSPNKDLKSSQRVNRISNKTTSTKLVCSLSFCFPFVTKWGSQRFVYKFPDYGNCKLENKQICVCVTYWASDSTKIMQNFGQL